MVVFETAEIAERIACALEKIAQAATPDTATMASLGFKDKLILLTVCTIAMWLLCRPLFEQWNRELAILDAENVTLFKPCE